MYHPTGIAVYVFIMNCINTIIATSSELIELDGCKRTAWWIVYTNPFLLRKQFWFELTCSLFCLLDKCEKEINVIQYTSYKNKVCLNKTMIAFKSEKVKNKVADK